jgi:hypothetical protein
MIKNFNQWNTSSSMQRLNEDARSSALNAVARQTGSTVDDLVKTGFKGVGSLIRKLFGASADDISKMEKGLADVINTQKQPWWQSLSKESRKALEKEGDEIAKKYISGYHSGSDELINAARGSSQKYLDKVRKIGIEQKAIDDLTAKVDDIPTRKMRAKFTDDLKTAQSSVDDAAKTGDLDKLSAARKAAQSTDDFIKDAGRGSVYSKPSNRFYGRSGILGRGLEPGANLSDDAAAALQSKGRDGLVKTLGKEMADDGKSNLDDISKGSRSRPSGEKGGLWNGFKRNLKRLLVISATVYSGGVAWNYFKNNQQNKGVETIAQGLDEMKDKLMNEGVTLTKIYMNKASFAEIFKLFFAGSGDDLPVDDAKELDAMLKAGSTMTDFFAKTSQLCFEYPEKYFKENENELKKSSLFYGFTEKLNEKIGIRKLIDVVNQAEGMASDAIEETFFDNGMPTSLDEYGYISFSNPNMKILLGSSEPVNMQDLIDESKEFLTMFSTFKRKVMNDFIQNEVTSSLKEEGVITQEEFEERSRRIEKDLGQQLSEKEEAFVAMTGLVLSYNIDRDPFKLFYGFDSDGLYSTVDSINRMLDQDFDLQSKKQLSRMYLALNSEFSDVYKEMGKQRTLYGVMEYSTFGIVMRSMMNLYALEKICKMVASSEAGDYQEAFTKPEVEDYQKVLNQIQRKEGKEPTVVVSGTLDDETQDAIKSYQEKLGLPATGKPGDKSLAKMKEYLVSLITSKQD